MPPPEPGRSRDAPGPTPVSAGVRIRRGGRAGLRDPVEVEVRGREPREEPDRGEKQPVGPVPEGARGRGRGRRRALPLVAPGRRGRREVVVRFGAHLGSPSSSRAGTALQVPPEGPMAGAIIVPSHVPASRRAAPLVTRP